MATRYTLLSWNVNGIRSIYRKGFVDWLRITEPDILCLQETKAHPEQLPDELVSVADYYAFFNAAKRKGYSGVAVYSKMQPQKVEKTLGIEHFDREGRVLILHYHEFTLINVYFPNGQASDERLRYKLDFYAEFLDYVDRLNNAGYNLIICGDVNTAHCEIDLSHPQENSIILGFLPIERAWIGKFLSHGFFDTFRLFNNEPGNYTWWSPLTNARDRNIGWRIDYFFVNRRFLDRVVSASILANVPGSDHCPIGLEIQI